MGKTYQQEMERGTTRAVPLVVLMNAAGSIIRGALE